MNDSHRGKCPSPIYHRKTSKGWINIAYSCHFVKNALLPKKSVYIDNFNAFNRQNGDSFINSCQRWTLVLWVHIYFVEKTPSNNRLFMFTSHVVSFVLGVSITLLSRSQVYARWHYQCELLHNHRSLKDVHKHWPSVRFTNLCDLWLVISLSDCWLAIASFNKIKPRYFNIPFNVESNNL